MISLSGFQHCIVYVCIVYRWIKQTTDSKHQPTYYLTDTGLLRNIADYKLRLSHSFVAAYKQHYVLPQASIVCAGTLLKSLPVSTSLENETVIAQLEGMDACLFGWFAIILLAKTLFSTEI